MTGAEEHEHRVLGGHKAIIHNANVREEVKEHSKQVLKEAGIDTKEVKGEITFEKHQTHDAHHDTRGHVHPKESGESDEAHQRRVLAAYKGILSKDSSSDEAKEHAREKLREAGEQV